MIEYEPVPARLFRARRTALLAGGAAAVLCVLAWLFDATQFYRSYLFGYLFWLGVALGCMGIVMLHHLVGGEWGLLIRRIGEAAVMTLPLLAVLFIPIALGIHHLYPWADPKELAGDVVLRHRRGLMNVPFFLLRAAVYFVVWIVLAWQLNRLSRAQDTSDDPAIARRLRSLSAGGMVLYFLTMSLASVDWIMSREVHWYSSVFGFIVIIGQSLSGFTFMLVILRRLADVPPVGPATTPPRLNDLGNLLLTLVILWAYMSFAQFLVIWMGNTQEDVIWYVHRSQGLWRLVAMALIALHFFVPFLLLLLKDAKRSLPALAGVARGILVLRVLDVLWMIAPSGTTSAPHGLSWQDFVTPVAIGGIWFAAFLWFLGGKPLMPAGERLPVETVDHAQTGTTRPVA